MAKFYYVYVLFDGKRFYIGYSSDLRKRVSKHGSGGVDSTKYRKGLKLIFYEAYLSKDDTKRREKYFKTAKGKKTLRLMIRDSLKAYYCPVV